MPQKIYRLSDLSQAQCIGVPFFFDEWTPFRLVGNFPVRDPIPQVLQGPIELKVEMELKLQMLWCPLHKLRVKHPAVIPFLSMITTTVDKFGFEYLTTFDVVFEKKWPVGSIYVRHPHGNQKDCEVRSLAVGEFTEAGIHPQLTALAV